MRKMRFDLIIIGFLIIGTVYINYKLIVNRPKTAVKTVVRIRKVDVIRKIFVKESNFNKARLTEFIKKENPAISPLLRKQIVTSAVASGKKFSIDPFVIVMVADVESRFNPFATNHHRSVIGLMQINRKVWLHNKKNRAALDTAGIITDYRQLYWVDKNIEAGAYILAHYAKQCKGKIGCILKRYSGSRRYAERFMMRIGAYYIKEVVAER